MQGNKTALLVGLIVAIVVAVGVIFFKMQNSTSAADQSRQEAVKARSSSPGFTPAPR